MLQKGFGNVRQISQKDSNVGWLLRTNRAQRAAERLREEVAKEIVDRLQRVERTKVSTQNIGSRLTPAENRTLPEAHYLLREPKTVVRVFPAQSRQSTDRSSKLGSLISKGLHVSRNRLH